MSPRLQKLSCMVAVLVAGCAAQGVGNPGDPLDPLDPPAETTPPTDPGGPPTPPSVPSPQGCRNPRPAGPTVAVDFEHWTSGALGEARHALSEPVVGLGEPFTLEARFRYGLISKDLEDEDVSAYVRLDSSCEWTELGTQRTDEDGMFVMDFDTGLIPGLGAYDVEIVVHGDLSRARGRIYVIAYGQPSVAFDIDGTLTLSDSELLGELYDGEPAEMYAGGPDVAWVYADAGYLIVYLTGRPHMLQDMSRVWLEERGFPSGPVFTGDNLLEASGPLVRVQKRERLIDLTGRAGLTFPYAYGNATTDVCAYSDAGIDPAFTYIIGPNGGAACDGLEPTVAIESYETHLATMGAVPPAWE